VDFRAGIAADSEAMLRQQIQNTASSRLISSLLFAGGEERRNRASGKKSGTGTGSRLGTAHQPKSRFGARLSSF